MVPRENKNKGYAKFAETNKEYKGSYPGVPVLYALWSHVGVVFYICGSHLWDHMWAKFQSISTWHEGFSPSTLFSLPLQNRLAVKKHLAWMLYSRIMHDYLAAAWGAFHMHLADPVWAAPFAIQPSGLQVRVISRTLLLLFI